jgi:hypothetical protein
MFDIAFAHPHTKYDSYTDFRKLAELTGFEICNVDQININKKTIYIICPHNGEVTAALKVIPKNKRTCKVALWFLERPIGKFEVFKARTKELLETEFDYIIFSDRAMYNYVKHLNGTKFVPCGSHTALGSLDHRDKQFDFCHMSYVWGRRGNVIDELTPCLKVGPNCWGKDRHEVLLKSRFMVNVHQDNDNFHEPLRFALCAAYGLPLISESCFDPYPYENGRDIITVPYGEMKNKIIQIIRDNNSYKDIGLRMWEKAVGPFSFVSNVKKFAENL